MPVDASTELVLYPSASNPGGDSATAGGSIGASPVTGGAAGEIFPPLAAKSSGTIDHAGDVEVQYQKAFWKNASVGSDLLLCRIYLANGLKRPVSAGTLSVVTTASSGDNGKKVKLTKVYSSALSAESINTTTGAGTATGGTAEWVERAHLVDATSGAQVTASEDITIKVGSEIIGVIPAGYSWATSEVKIAGVATLNDTGTSTNRKTAPAGLTFVYANSYATGIVIKLDTMDDTIPHGDKQGFWGQQSLQPGMTPSDDVEYVWVLEGESGA